MGGAYTTMAGGLNRYLTNHMQAVMFGWRETGNKLKRANVKNYVLKYSSVFVD